MLTGFAVSYADALHTDQDSFDHIDRTEDEHSGLARVTDGYRSHDGFVGVRRITLNTPEGASISWIELRNTSTAPLRISRVDSFHCGLPSGEWTLYGYNSTWGREFDPVEMKVAGSFVLESRSGRSANGMSPYFTLVETSGLVCTAAIAWSGNWQVRVEPTTITERSDGSTISGGLSDWEFGKVLNAGEIFRSPETIFVHVDGADTEKSARILTTAVERHWIPRSELADEMPVEWNTWWPYEDKRIDEDVFKANVDVCARLGFDVCTLDAGWYGPGGSELSWWERRGDWHIIDGARFPSGLKALADYTRGRGLSFGLWCEIEAVDAAAELNHLRPELIALRDGARIGYVCMGNPATVDWAFATIADIIESIGAEWIKLDSNFDPGAGCNRTDHGHGDGDGLYEHIRGYYSLLDRIRVRYPRIVLENCASGGLRFDLGIMRHMPLAFLSDPDYTEHTLQVTWGAFGMLPPRACLGFAWSQGKQGEANLIDEPIEIGMSKHKFDYIIRAAMLRHFACSYRMPDLPAWCQEHLREHISLYKSTVRRFVRDASVFRLSAQPKRGCTGDRWAAFQYAMPDGGESLLMVFRLMGGEPIRTFKLAGVDLASGYRVRPIDSSIDSTSESIVSGRDLREDGITFRDMPEESAVIALIERLP